MTVRKVAIQLLGNPSREFRNATTEAHPDNDGSVAYKLSSGKYYTVTPDGDEGTDRTSAGAWEKFHENGANLASAYRSDRDKTYGLMVLDR